MQFTYKCAIAFALAGLIAAILAYYFAARLSRCNKDKFSAQAKDVHTQSLELFRRAGPDVTYSEYKTNVPGADPVLYTDIRQLWRGGQLTLAAVQRAM
jgi:hypothetical protein